MSAATSRSSRPPAAPSSARGDRARIPGIDVEVDDGDRYRFGEAEAEVFFMPGHTSGHIAYAFRDQRALFCGDTMFALGCGKMFEGTPQQFWTSLAPPARPARRHAGLLRPRIHPVERPLRRHHRDRQQAADGALGPIDAARARGEATVPSLLGEEKATNPFLRADVPAVQKAVGMPGGDPVTVFAEVRHRKDVFR